MPKINPQNLTWAREGAGLSLEEAARAIGLSGQEAVERLAAMERGEREPTRRQLAEMAKRYHRPLLTFYLPAPPREGPKAHDLRTTRQRDDTMQARLDTLVRDIRARQALVRAALEDVEEAEPLPFVGSVRVEQGAAAIAAATRETLAFDLAAFRAARGAEGAFKVLRAAVEGIGVYVVLMGNLGHHATSIPASVFRGLALADEVAPFVVVNENDTRAAWSFTLLHELAHVFLGQTAISGYGATAKVEAVCDEAAALILLPREELREFRADGGSTDELADAVGSFADVSRVSRTMVAYNLLKAGRIDPATYRALTERFDRERQERQADRKAGGGADYYTVRRHRVGDGLTRLVGRLVADGVLSTTKAGRVLGVQPMAVERMTAGKRAA